MQGRGGASSLEWAGTGSGPQRAFAWREEGEGNFLLVLGVIEGAGHNGGAVGGYCLSFFLFFW